MLLLEIHPSIYPPMIHSASGHCTGAIPTRIYLIQFLWPGSTTHELESSTYSYPKEAIFWKQSTFGARVHTVAKVLRSYIYSRRVAFSMWIIPILIITILKPSYYSVYPLMLSINWQNDSTVFQLDPVSALILLYSFPCMYLVSSMFRQFYFLYVVYSTNKWY